MIHKKVHLVLLLFFENTGIRPWPPKLHAIFSLFIRLILLYENNNFNSSQQYYKLQTKQYIIHYYSIQAF